MYNQLFSSKAIGTMEVPNRIVMTAMGNHLANEDGTVSKEDIAFYGARARGGIGLVITECACVDFATGKGNLRQIAVDDDKHIPGLRALAEEVHKYGSRLAVQIYHPGRQGIAAVNGVDSMMAPSQTECQCVHQPTHEMTLEEIKRVQGQFISGAKRLQEAGVDAVELHGAHGYLIGQFLSPYTNHRTDCYGGSFENRMRFLDEIIDGVRQECGEGYPVLVRFSVDEHMEYAGRPECGLHLADGVEIAKHLEQKGVDALDISAGIYETMNVAWEPVSFAQGWKMEGPEAVKKAVGIPVIAASVIRDPAYAEQALAQGKCDFVGSARAFFADAEWACKAKEGREKEIRHCISCLYCMETLMAADTTLIPMACAINFEGCREAQYSEGKLKKNGNGRAVAVIGAGPAGMEAARVLAMRGFKPVVFEKQSQVGGQVLLASKPPKKEKTATLIEYQKHQLEKYGVEIRLDTTPGIEDIKALGPCAVFVSYGSNPIMPSSIKGLDGDKVYTPVEILNGGIVLEGKNVCVVGSGMTGIETAELLCEQGNKVSVFEMADEIGPGIFFQNLIDVMGRVDSYGAKLYPKRRLVEIDGTTAIFETTDTKQRESHSFDAVVVSLGTAPNMELREELEKEFGQLKYLGDAKKAGRIENAIRTGYLAAVQLD